VGGRRVGLVDADLYGPDVPRMLGLRRKRAASSVTLFAARGQMGSRLEVIERHGIQLASAGAYRSLARELDQRIGTADSTQYARERE
jgi:Mrp family chromosome partitioning ATPase